MSKARSKGTWCRMVKLLFSLRSRCSHSKRLLFPICTNDQWLQSPTISTSHTAPSTIDRPEADTGQISHRLEKGSLIYIFIPSDPAQVFDFVFISLSKLKAFSTLPLKSPIHDTTPHPLEKAQIQRDPKCYGKRGLGKLDRHELFPHSTTKPQGRTSSVIDLLVFYFMRFPLPSSQHRASSTLTFSVWVETGWNQFYQFVDEFRRAIQLKEVYLEFQTRIQHNKFHSEKVCE